MDLKPPSPDQKARNSFLPFKLSKPPSTHKNKIVIAKLAYYKSFQLLAFVQNSHLDRMAKL
jgi:hypothetical protein